MSRVAVWTMAVLAVLIAGLVGLKWVRRTPQVVDHATEAPLSDTGKAMLTAESRKRIKAFWAIYQQATEERQKGQWQAAARDYQKALEIQPDHWDSLYYLGSVLMEQKQYAAAEQAYRRLAASDTQPARTYSALGALYANPNAGRLFNLKRAAHEYERAQRANADESGSVLRLGEVALASGEMARAKEYLQAAGRTNYKSVNAPFLLGYIAWEAGDRSSALALYRQAITQTKVQKPPAGVLGEGDTKLPGYRAMVLPGQRGMFDAFVAALWHDKDVNAAKMEWHYRRVRAFLRGLPRRK
jgi:tetratricopeptide (TPR) repeat protein